jgi:hypothetical protein
LYFTPSNLFNYFCISGITWYGLRKWRAFVHK